MNMLHTAPDVDAFKSLLKARNLKATPQRVAIHEAMLSLGHASADMVCDWLLSHSPASVTVASVYNTLSQLSEKGIYSPRMSSNNKMYFDVNTFRHIHLYDSRNHCYRDVMDDDLCDAIDSFMKRKRFRGYSIDGYDFQIICHPTSKKG